MPSEKNNNRQTIYAFKEVNMDKIPNAKKYKKTVLFILLIHLSINLVTAQGNKSIFISEYIANQGIAALEIYNPTPDTIRLKGYSIIRQGAYRFNFPGGILLPYDVWVGCRGDIPQPNEIQAVADTSWPATGSIWYLGNDQKIELLRNDTVIDVINGDPRNNTVAGIDGALYAHTLVRKPHIRKGEISWDTSRGTNTDDSQWIVYGTSVYSYLGDHRTDDTTTTILPGIYPMANDTIILAEELSADSILKNINPSGRASLIITDLAGNALSSGLVRNNYRLKVTADAGNEAYYVFRVLAGEGNEDIGVESMIYTVLNDSITNVSAGTASETVLRKLFIFPQGVTARITDHTGNPKTGAVASGDKVELTARDGLTKKLLTISCHEPVIPSAFQVHNIAKSRVLPVGAPAYSDVNMTSRDTRTPTIRTGPVALDAARAFHGTNFRWCYITGSTADKYPRVNNWIINDIIGNGFKISAAYNTAFLSPMLLGETLPYDTQAELEDGTTGQLCGNKPHTRQFIWEHILAGINMGAFPSPQFDDRSFPGYDEVCICSYCKSKAAEWGMDIGSEEFRSRTQMEVFNWIQAKTFEYYNQTGVRIGYSANGGSRHAFYEKELWDFNISECDPRWGWGPDKYFSDERLVAEPMGKMLVFNLSVKGMYIEDPSIPWKNRSIIGLAYGTGGNCIVPWDSYMDPVKDYPYRYFGKPSVYADLFGFIRANSRLLEGYETAFDYMPAYNDPRYGGEKPITITGNNRAFAFIRAVPGDSSAAVVIHLVDWKETPPPQSMQVNLKSEYFFNGKDYGIFLVEPTPYDPRVHLDVISNADRYLKPGTFRGAEHEAIYSPLRKITRLVPERNGSVLSVSIDSIPAYAMLVLIPSDQNQELTSDELLVDQDKMLIKGFNASIHTSELLSKLKRSPLTSWMALDERGIPVYDRVQTTGSLVVVSPEGRQLARYSLEEGDAPGLELELGGKTVPEGSTVVFEPVPIDSAGNDYAFKLRNMSSEVFRLDTIFLEGGSDFSLIQAADKPGARPDTVWLEGKPFRTEYSIGEIQPGESAEFIIRFYPDKKGIHRSGVWVRSAVPGVLPFVFNLEGEGLAAGIQVYQGERSLKPGSGIVEMGSVKFDQDSILELSIVNTGNQALKINAIGTGKPEILTVLAFDTLITPEDTGKMRLKFSPSGENKWELVELRILNNSFISREYLLYGVGFGLEAKPEMKVEHNSVLFQNNAGIVDFGNVQLNTTEIRKVVIRNAGPDNLYISGVQSGMFEFQITAAPAKIEPGSTDTIFISFTPFMKMTYSTNITVKSNDKSNAVFRFTVTGRGDDITHVAGPDQFRVHIFPNPAVSELNILVSGSFGIRLLDVQGRILIQRKDCSDRCVLDVDHLKGLYILEIQNDSKIVVERIMIH